LRDVPARPDRIRVQAAGFEPHADERPRFPAGRDVPYDVTLRAVPGLRGLVLAEDQPVVGAQVTLHGLVRRPLAFARTDDDGRFFLPWVDGATTVSAQQGQYGTAREPVSGPGEIVLRLPLGGFIAGRVVDQAGRPVEDFSVSASPLTWGRGGPPAQSFSSEDGHFLLGPLAAGRMEIWAAAEGYQPAERRGVEVRAGETVEGITLTLRTSVVLEGQVTDARTGRPVEGAQVVPAEWRSGALAEAVGTYTDADGRYRLDALPGVRTSIRVKAEGYRSVLIGGVEGAPGSRVVRDFALNPQASDALPGSELTGVGAVLASHPDGVRIGQILPGGPAEGVLAAGDVVVSVDGDPIQGADMGKVAQAIRGEEGSEVELMVRRGGDGPPERVVLVRGRVTVPDRHHMPRN
ncbi:MAG: carboxypeptidase regulatory-like domain-containing protein, partial [Myxococcales bacterium]|nr:carboxypeptidase regulatory-like domain-containing protein [Myxococcales bacterium]